MMPGVGVTFDDDEVGENQYERFKRLNNAVHARFEAAYVGHTRGACSLLCGGESIDGPNETEARVCYWINRFSCLARIPCMFARLRGLRPDGLDSELGVSMMTTLSKVGFIVPGKRGFV